MHPGLHFSFEWTHLAAVVALTFLGLAIYQACRRWRSRRQAAPPPLSSSDSLPDVIELSER
jgi:hypothetical protein